MPDLNTIVSPVHGDYGIAIELPIAEDRQSTALGWWVFTATVRLHPVFTQWVVGLVGLQDIPGKATANLHFDGATHELMLMAIDPQTPITPESAAEPGFIMRWLEPINMAHQFTATDDEMRLLLAGSAWSIAYGLLPPEPALSYDRFREDWLTALVKTLAHIRGEAHAE